MVSYLVRSQRPVVRCKKSIVQVGFYRSRPRVCLGNLLSVLDVSNLSGKFGTIAMFLNRLMRK